MLTLRRSCERGHADHGWLNTHHTFSFAEYRDPRHMGFRALRVINDDIIAPGMGFGAHGHRDMEIVTYVLDGALAHRDSMGNQHVLKAGEVQRISAGSGIMHSEFNASDAEPVHLLQIWILPDKDGAVPSYEEGRADLAQAAHGWAAIASPGGVAGGMDIGQDVHILLARPSRGSAASHALLSGRAAWVHVVRGSATVNGAVLGAGDAAAVEDEAAVTVTGVDDDAEVLLFDLA